MSSRIRYVETNNPGILESVKVFISSFTGARYKVFINLNNYSFRIRNENTKNNTVMKEGGINNINVLKRSAKKSLEKLGVRFDDESRNRTFGLCEKGYTQKKHLNTKFPSDNRTE